MSKKKQTVATKLSLTQKHEEATQESMNRQENCTMFYLPIVVLIVSICVVPLTAEISSINFKYQKPSSLKMDEALLTVNNDLSTDVIVSWTSQECYQCLYQIHGKVNASISPGQPSSSNFIVNTQYGLTIMLNDSSATQLCNEITFHFGEHGNYTLWIKNLTKNSETDCSIVTDEEPVNSYIPILIGFLVLAGIFLLFAVGQAVLKLEAVKRIFFQLTGSMETERLINSELGSPGRTVTVSDNILPPPASPNRRLRSLDTFRGISLIIMVFVNYGGGRYWFFRHSSWNGLTVADLVFPWFVFIMGTSIALSINILLRSGSTRSSVLKKVLWRTLLLFVIGVVIINPNYCQGPISWQNLRIPGVLQRLSLSYLVVACLDLLVARAHLDIITMDTWWSPVLDILLYWPSWLFVLLLEVTWLCLTFLLPVPGCPTGYLGPGGMGDFGLFANCTGGAAGFIDRWLLKENHIYQTPSSRVIYATQIPFDPEGILGSINSIVMAFLGLQVGKIILHYRDQHRSIMSRFLIWGLFLGILSAILTKCSKDQGFIPVNKNLWSLSYVTTLACFGFVLLVLLYYIIDVRKWWSGAPFYYPGMNSILVYVGHEVFEEYFPFRWQMVNNQSHAEHLTQNIVATTCWIIISYILYKKRIFWKI